MNEAQNSHRPPRKDCQYSAMELQQIRQYKNIYKTSTKPDRLLMMKGQILPAMFNYWEAQGQGAQSEEENRMRAKVKKNDSRAPEKDSDIFSRHYRSGAQTTGAGLNVLNVKPRIGNRNVPILSGGVMKRL